MIAVFDPGSLFVAQGREFRFWQRFLHRRPRLVEFAIRLAELRLGLSRAGLPTLLRFRRKDGATGE